jgi:hypothetical protein
LSTQQLGERLYERKKRGRIAISLIIGGVLLIVGALIVSVGNIPSSFKEFGVLSLYSLVVLVSVAMIALATATFNAESEREFAAELNRLMRLYAIPEMSKRGIQAAELNSKTSEVVFGEYRINARILKSRVMWLLSHEAGEEYRPLGMHKSIEQVVWCIHEDIQHQSV